MGDFEIDPETGAPKMLSDEESVAALKAKIIGRFNNIPQDGEVWARGSSSCKSQWPERGDTLLVRIRHCRAPFGGAEPKRFGIDIFGRSHEVRDEDVAHGYWRRVRAPW